MKILLVTANFAAENVNPWLLDDLAAAFAADGHDVDVVVHSPTAARERGTQPATGSRVTAWSVGAAKPRLLLAVTLAGLVSGRIASILSPTVYTSTAKLLVSVQSPSDATPAELTQANALGQQKAASYVDLVTGPRILNPVIDSLNLKTMPAALAAHIAATSMASSAIITITATNSNADQAADIANAVSRALSDLVVSTVEKPQGGGVSPVQLTVAQPAVTATAPTSPRTNLNLALGTILGLALGIAAVLVRPVLDSRIHNLTDVEAVTELLVLGGIVCARRAAEGGLVVRDDPNSAQAEAFRRLRTNLRALDFGGGPRSIVITSSMRERYRELFAGVNGVEIFGGRDDAADNFWLTSIVIDSAATGWTPAELSAALLHDNIESRPLWKPMHLQPVFNAARALTNGNSERLFLIGLTLPSGSALHGLEIDRVIELLGDFVKSR